MTSRNSKVATTVSEAVTTAITEDVLDMSTYFSSKSKYSDLQLTEVGGEMALFFLMQLIFFTVLFSRLNGRFLRMEPYVAALEIPLFGNTFKPMLVTVYYIVIGYFYLILPIVTVLFWGLCLLFQGLEDTSETQSVDKLQRLIPGISILCVGISTSLLVCALLKVRYNNWRFKTQHLVMLILSYLVFFGWIVTLLISAKNEYFTFYAASAIFMTQNGIVATVGLTLNMHSNKFNLVYFIERFMKQDADDQVDGPDPTRTNDLEEEVNEQMVDHEWYPKRGDLFDIITIGKVSEKRMTNAFGIGFAGAFHKGSKGLKCMVNLFILILYFALSLVYAWIDYNFNERSKLGLVSAMTILLIDLFIVLMFRSKIIVRVTFLSVLLFAARFFVCFGGANYWIYGYMIIYIWKGIVLTKAIAQKNLPLTEQIEANAQRKTPAYFELSNLPEFQLLVITLGLIVAMILAFVFKPNSVNLIPLNFYGNVLEYYTVAFLSVLVIISLQLIFCVQRAFLRKVQNIKSKTTLFLINKQFDTYYILLTTLYLVILAWTLCAYTFLIKHYEVVVVGSIIPLIVFSFMNQFIYYSRNGNAFLQDCNQINQQIQAHNTRVKKTRAKAKQIKRKIAEDGPEAVYGKESGRLVLKVMQLEEKLKLEARLMREEGQNDDQEQNNSNKKGGFQFRRESTANPNLLNVQTPAANNDPANFGSTIAEMDFDSGSEDETNMEKNLQKGQSSGKRQKQVYDWSKDLNGLSAYMKGKLRPNDYGVINSLITTFLLILILAGLSYLVTKSFQGFEIAIVVLHVIIVAISFQNVIMNRAKFTYGELFLFFFSYVIMYGSSIGYMFFKWPVVDLFKQEQEGTMDEETKKEFLAMEIFLTEFIIIVPFLTALVALIAKGYADSQTTKPLTMPFWLLLSFNIIQSIGLVWALFVFADAQSAVEIIVIIVVVVYLLLQFLTLRKVSTMKPIKIGNEGSKAQITPYMIKSMFRFLNFFFVFALFIGVLVVAESLPQMSTYASVSLIVLIVCTLLFLMVLVSFLTDVLSFRQMPVFYTPWVLPAYRYRPDKDTIERNFDAVYVFFSTISILVLWGLITIVQVEPRGIGICITCSSFALVVIFVCYTTNLTSVEFNKVKTFVDKMVIKQAWLNAKKELINELSLSSRSEFVSYETLWRRRFCLRNYINLRRGFNSMSFPETSEFAQDRQQAAQSASQLDFFRQKCMEWIDPDECDLNSIQDCLAFVYELDLEIKEAYMAEYETIIQFQLMILQLAETLREQEMHYLTRFVKEKRAELYLIGIKLETRAVNGKNGDKARYLQLIEMIQSMSSDKQTLFNMLREQYIQQQRENDANEKEGAMAAEREAIARGEAQAKKAAQKKEALKKLDPNMPIDQMPDCRQKYDKIVSQFKIVSQKYTDAQFDATKNPAKVLGERIAGDFRNNMIHKWVRASEIEGACLFKDGASCEDITQGALGDCYFLSALSVLGDERIRGVFASERDQDPNASDDQQIWKRTGCFRLKFYKNGSFEDIIVDDYIPVNDQNECVFTRGGTDGLEMWPTILEKAYAKLYGSYSTIEAGKVHLALADLTEEGFPEQIALASKANNLMSLEALLKKLDKNGALLGAGTPEHEMGDRAVNEEGIVQGHAYAVLDIDEFEGEQLIQLRNPHGKSKSTNEWTGDWSDTSNKWTAKAKKELKYQPQEDADGIFWMASKSFVENFKYIYICRSLVQKDGWFSPRNIKGSAIRDQWKGASSAGFPSRKMKSLPQFLVTITHPCSGFISLRQKSEDAEVDSSFKGKNYIAWMLVKNEGDPVTRIEKQKVIAKAGISNLSIISAAVEFDSTLTYPYDFTILCASKVAGPEGEGAFELSIYAQDDGIKIRKV